MVVRQVSERFVDDMLVIVFEAVEPGTTTIVLATTAGESAVPIAASYFEVTVTLPAESSATTKAGAS